MSPCYRPHFLFLPFLICSYSIYQGTNNVSFLRRVDQASVSSINAFELSHHIRGEYAHRNAGSTAKAQELLNLSSRGIYHSWPDGGVDFFSILRFIDVSYTLDVNHPYKKKRRGESEKFLARLWAWYQPFPIFILVHNNTPSIYISDRLKQRIQRGSGARFQRALPFYQRALRDQLYRYRDHFPALVGALTSVGSVPVPFHLSDSHCPSDPSNTEKHNHITGIPLLTTSRSWNCSYAFPTPTYAEYDILKLSKDRSWEETMDGWDKSFPWGEKIRKVYWKGGIKSHRELFLERSQIASSGSAYMDVTPLECHKRGCNHDPIEISMKYKACFDIDGNSWSERFPRLLCFNSAVIKVTIPNDEEAYFMADLRPNVHYIPADLNNFTLVAYEMMQPEQDDFLRSIVRNANAFCRERMTEASLNFDFLKVVDSYVDTLNRGWADEWRDVKESYLGNDTLDLHGGYTDWTNGPLQHLPSSELWNLEKYRSRHRRNVIMDTI